MVHVSIVDKTDILTPELVPCGVMPISRERLAHRYGSLGLSDAPLTYIITARYALAGHGRLQSLADTNVHLRFNGSFSALVADTAHNARVTYTE